MEAILRGRQLASKEGGANAPSHPPPTETLISHNMHCGATFHGYSEVVIYTVKVALPCVIMELYLVHACNEVGNQSM